MSSGERNNNSNNNKNLHREVKTNSYYEIKAETRTDNQIQINGDWVKNETDRQGNDKERCKSICCKYLCQKKYFRKFSVNVQ